MACQSGLENSIKLQAVGVKQFAAIERFVDMLIVPKPIQFMLIYCAMHAEDSSIQLPPNGQVQKQGLALWFPFALAADEA